MSKSQEIIDWQGISLSVSYAENEYGSNVHHIEIHVLHPQGAALPITGTGYRSHFFHESVEAYGGPAAYVRAWLDNAAQAPEWKRRQEVTRQFSLF